ncbi:heterokaryon incompatibility protein-domain-containing protein [Dactylonectria macrodidyma]|uniref:Heterokaryon incompatibility protein-domain-containing protein n=1 Tax=Dactylonectria macrodidyma TaxID=307937 RepID=A0A9P9FUR5_9HYPO|nr:heterokaryon incompatibility protein-domain-containing protein [Dactylonectria macrodidyma]
MVTGVNLDQSNNQRPWHLYLLACAPSPTLIMFAPKKKKKEKKKGIFTLHYSTRRSGYYDADEHPLPPSTGPAECSVVKGPAFTALNHEIGIDRISLTACPSFVALSYVWGSPDRDYRLTLCDNSFLPITKSVANALVYVLNDIEEGFIWIDQICINQSNTEERNQQVAKMGDIYRKACKVFVWLGLEGDGAERVDRIFQDFEKSRVDSTTDTALREAFIFSLEAHLNRQAMISVMKLP